MNTPGALRAIKPPRTRRRGQLLRAVVCHLVGREHGPRMPVVGVWVVVLMLCWTSVGVACPTCKDALADSDPAHARMVAGYFYSILFMMSVPFILVGSFCGYAYMLVRRARSASPAEKTRHP